MFWFFGWEACGVLTPWPGIKPVTPALEGRVLTTGLPGKVLFIFHLSFISLDLRGKEQCDEKGDEVTKDSPSHVLIPLTGCKGVGSLCESRLESKENRAS